MAIATGQIAERVLSLGGERALVSVASYPANASQQPCVLILNAGVLHRVGPHRLHVLLARRLASSGAATVRIDLSGIGDSRALPGDMTFRASAVADVRAAMDQLGQDDGAQRFVLFGVCSGADNALATAEADPRVAGLMLIDPPAYATGAARWRRRLADLRHPGRLVSLPLRALQSLARRLRVAGGAARSPAPGRQSPPLDQYRRQLSLLAERGVRMLSVYSGALGERYNAPDQLFEALPEMRGRMDLVYYPDANHTFTERRAQQQLMATLVGWYERQFGAGA